MRNLERELSTLIRKAVKELIMSKKKSVKVEAHNLADYLGVPKYRYGGRGTTKEGCCCPSLQLLS